MATKNSTPSQLHNVVQGRVTIVNADASAYKTVLTITGGDSSEEAHIYSIILTSDDTSNRDLLFAINNGTNDIEQGAILLPASTGLTVAAPPIQVIANRTSPVLSRVFKDIRGNYFLVLASGDTLKVKSLTTVTAAKTIVVAAFGYNFKRS